MDRPGEVAHAEVLGVREDAAVLDVAPVVQDEDAPVLEGRHRQAHRGPAKEGLELVLEPLEPLGRDDGLLVDEVPLDGGEHLLVRDVRRAQDGEAGERERVRREQLPEELGSRAAPEQLARRAASSRGGTGRERPDLEEPGVELDPEVALEPGVRVARGQDERVVHVERHAVVGPQDRVVRVEEPSLAPRPRRLGSASPGRSPASSSRRRRKLGVAWKARSWKGTGRGAVVLGPRRPRGKTSDMRTSTRSRWRSSAAGSSIGARSSGARSSARQTERATSPPMPGSAATAPRRRPGGPGSARAGTGTPSSGARAGSATGEPAGPACPCGLRGGAGRRPPPWSTGPRAGAAAPALPRLPCRATEPGRGGGVSARGPARGRSAPSGCPPARNRRSARPNPTLAASPPSRPGA